MTIAWQPISDHIGQQLQQNLSIKTAHPVSGGCINQAFRLDCQQQNRPQAYFIKLNQAAQLAMFEAEVAGLQAIADSQTIRVPEVVAMGKVGNQAYLLLTLFESGSAKQPGWATLGQQLALLHAHTQPRFGWHRDNTIGRSPQKNQWQADWVTFWTQQRLGFQLQLAAQQGYGGQLQQLGEQLLLRVGDFFSSYQPQASLLHGDLWSGNVCIDVQQHPYLFDPAVYYGDRETDLAMTELFGGFGADFYAAYQAQWALDVDYQQRKPLYNLYHILNHLNLFGGGYLAQSQRLLQQLLSFLR